MYNVLIVDDEPLARKGLKKIVDWEEYGFHILDEAKNGFEAYKLLQKRQYDLIFLDLKMPNMNGLELAAKIRKDLSSHVKIILLSGVGEFKYAREAMAYHISDYLLKPVEIMELIQVLHAIKIELDQVKMLKESKKMILLAVGRHYLMETLNGRKSEQTENGLIEIFSKQTQLQYLHIEICKNDVLFNRLDFEEKSAVLWELYDELLDYIKGYEENCICHIVKNQVFEIGVMISSQFLLNKEFMDVDSFIEGLKHKIKLVFSYKLCYFLGNKVCSVKNIRDSYLSALNKKIDVNVEQDEELLCKIKKELLEKYENNLSLKQLSEEYYINSAYLGQLFKKKYGVYFKDYLNMIRIEKAKELLCYSNDKVYMIAERVGYNNVDYFINKFTRVVGTTPNKFRSQYMKKNNTE